MRIENLRSRNETVALDAALPRCGGGAALDTELSDQVRCVVCYFLFLFLFHENSFMKQFNL